MMTIQDMFTVCNGKYMVKIERVVSYGESLSKKSKRLPLPEWQNYPLPWRYLDDCTDTDTKQSHEVANLT